MKCLLLKQINTQNVESVVKQSSDELRSVSYHNLRLDLVQVRPFVIIKRSQRKPLSCAQTLFNNEKQSGKIMD